MFRGTFHKLILTPSTQLWVRCPNDPASDCPSLRLCQYVATPSSHLMAQLLMSFAAIILLIFAIWSDRIQMRYPFILAGLCMCAIGFAINLADVPIGVKYFGTFFCVSGSYAAFPGIVAWYARLCDGRCKCLPIYPGLEITSLVSTREV